jgi:phosphoribosylformylglycinamidine synthase
MVMADTVQRPGGDAAVVRVHGTGKALAISTDCTPRYCYADPFEGGKQAVAEVWRNITAVGGKPLAITDCLNFGNPERPEIMGQLVTCIQGMGEACKTLEFPVVSGNVSLYNETSGEGIRPTPAIGGVGLLQDVAKAATIALKEDGLDIVLVGATEGHLGRSVYLRDVVGRDEGAPPPVDLAVERRNGDFVRGQIDAKRVAASHDLSDGGLFVALAEMAMAGGTGASIEAPKDLPLHAWLFGEDQARYLIATADSASLLAEAEKAGVLAAVIGKSGGGELTVNGSLSISVGELKTAHEGWMPAYMSAP